MGIRIAQRNLCRQGKIIPEVCEEIDVSENTYYGARKGLKSLDELLNRELFLSINELIYVADCWRMDYNYYLPHSSLDYMAPAAFIAMCLEQVSATLRLTQDKENYCEILS